MRFTSTVRDAFEAAHRVEGHSMCGSGHGHAWEVAVTVEGGLDPKKVLVVDHGLLAAALRSVINEVRGRDLNDMLPGVITTPEGIGLFVRERLILDFPRIVSVTVRMGPTVEVQLQGDIR